MILVIAWCMVLMGLALVITQSVVRQIAPSERSAHQYAALAAAEAGVDDYRARLLVKADYFVLPDPTNPALTGWAPVPGGNTDAEFTYAIDKSRAGAGGDLRVYVTGRSPRGVNGVTRTIEAQYDKRSTLDYVYLSDIETAAPDLPNAYSTTEGSGGVTTSASDDPTARDLANVLCSRYWYVKGPTKPATSRTNWTNGTFVGDSPRNINFCEWAQIGSSERLAGKIHTNDVWRLQNTDLSAALDQGLITSSCPDSPPATFGCASAHRYISASFNSSPTAPASWSSSLDPEPDSPNPASGSDSTNRNPRFDSQLLLPKSPALLKVQAALSGCVFTGPTRILFGSDAGGPYMYVTSPDTKKTGPNCDGTAGGTALRGTATSHPSPKVYLSGFTDLVIYVQNVPTSGASDATNPYLLLNNEPLPADIPTCKVKYTDSNPARSSKYPYVIPSDSLDQALFNNSSTEHYKGFPDEYADLASPWYKDNCSSGDLYVQGVYKGNYTIATEGNIAITGDLADSTAPLTPEPSVTASTPSTSFGKPEMGSSTVPASTSNLGLVSDKFTYVYRPSINSDGDVVSSWKTSNVDNVVINAAILVIDQCFAGQDGTIGPRQGYIFMYGSLAQHYRCAVGRVGSSGYSKAYRYDTRLAYRTPPYMLKLSDDPWRNGRIGEVTPVAQKVNTSATYSVLTADELNAGATLGAAVGFDNTRGSASKSGSSSIAVTPTAAGLFVASYEVTTTGTTTPEIRRLVIQVS